MTSRFGFATGPKFFFACFTVLTVGVFGAVWLARWKALPGPVPVSPAQLVVDRAIEYGHVSASGQDRRMLEADLEWVLPVMVDSCAIVDDAAEAAFNLLDTYERLILKGGGQYAEPLPQYVAGIGRTSRDGPSGFRFWMDVYDVELADSTLSGCHHFWHRYGRARAEGVPAMAALDDMGRKAAIEKIEDARLIRNIERLPESYSE